MAKIERLLQRRTDLSTFLVHLTRAGEDGSTARENLVAMIGGDDEGVSAIKAGKPMGPARDYDELLGLVATQKVVCFTETPLEHIWMMLKDIEGRQVHFEPWGLATTKTAGRKAGCSPVWYTNKSANDWTTNPGKYVRQMITEAVARSKTANGGIDSSLLQAEPIFRITPYVEEMGASIDGTPKEFWWEREWRHVGDYSLGFPSRIVAILAPEDEHDSLQQELAGLGLNRHWLDRPIIDPRWGLERMIATISRVNEDYVGPFPTD